MKVLLKSKQTKRFSGKKLEITVTEAFLYQQAIEISRDRKKDFASDVA